MSMRRAALFVAFLVLTLILIFPLRAELSGWIIKGAAFIIWMFKVALNIIPQQVMWMFLLILLLYIAVGSFHEKRLKRGAAREIRKQTKGPVEELSHRIAKHKGGIYFKWKIANMLGKVAHFMLEKENNSSQKITGRGWSPTREVEEYLDAGLNSSYVNYQTRGLFHRSPPGPLDLPPETAVAYLEEQMEIRNDES